MIQISKGQILFRQGDAGDSAYIVEKGQIYIYLEQDKEEIPLAMLGQGEIFGEMSLIDNQNRSASARAAVDTSLSVVTKEQLMERMFTADPVVKLLLNVLLKRLRLQNTALLSKEAQEKEKAKANAQRELIGASNEAIEQIKFENLVYEAFRKNQFEMFYQPIVDLKNRKINGCEALLRWKDPEKGYVSPGVFIDVIESSSMVLPIGMWILDQSMKDAKELIAKKNNPNFTVSVNVSTKQFADPRFIEELEGLRKKHDLRPTNIKLEVTERVMMEGAVVIETLRQCRHIGYEIAIDDFGTGFSSLQYLSSMPLSSLKVDRSFVMKVNSDPKVRAIVHSLIFMSKSLGLEVVAEGIETEEELQSVFAMGAEKGQGYLFSKPIPFSQFLNLEGV